MKIEIPSHFARTDVGPKRTFIRNDPTPRFVSMAPCFYTTHGFYEEYGDCLMEYKQEYEGLFLYWHFLPGGCYVEAYATGKHEDTILLKDLKPIKGDVVNGNMYQSRFDKEYEDEMNKILAQKEWEAFLGSKPFYTRWFYGMKRQRFEAMQEVLQ